MGKQMQADMPYIEERLRSLAVLVESLREDPENVRTHPERNIEAIKRSLQGFGQQKPIVVTDDGVCVAGSGTLAAAKSLGWQYIAAIQTSLTREQAKAYAIADNRTGELAEWNYDDLSSLLTKLRDNTDDVTLTGFSDDEITSLLLNVQQEGDSSVSPKYASSDYDYIRVVVKDRSRMDEVRVAIRKAIEPFIGFAEVGN